MAAPPRHIELSTRSVRRARARAGVMPALALLVLATLTTSSVASLVRGSPTPREVRTVSTEHDSALWALAESFTARYLNWDSARSDEYESRLAPLNRGTGVTLPPRGAQRVVRVTAVAARPAARSGGQVVTVEAATTRGIVYLAVPVRLSRGYGEIAGWPALVGPPAVRAQSPIAEEPVGDRALRDVVMRALSNYLAGDATNLRADLTAEAVVSLPSERLAVERAVGVTWVRRPGTVAAELRVRDRVGMQMTLRYELDVVQSDRWSVRRIHTNPLI